MKLLIICCCLLNLVPSSTNAQLGCPPPCDQAKQVRLDTDLNKQRILLDFIRSCEEKYWLNDKGIVLLREYQATEGRQCWLLLPSIDDSYKDNPPNRFATLNGDIILIFDAYSNGQVKSVVGDTTGLNQCLEQIIGNRVYTRPTIKTRWTDNVMPSTNRKRRGVASGIHGDNEGTLLIVFNLDGSYEKFLPVNINSR